MVLLHTLTLQYVPFSSVDRLLPSLVHLHHNLANEGHQQILQILQGNLGLGHYELPDLKIVRRKELEYISTLLYVQLTP